MPSSASQATTYHARRSTLRDLYDSELETVATNRMQENSAFPTGQEPDTKKSVNSNPFARGDIGADRRRVVPTGIEPVDRVFADAALTCVFGLNSLV